MLAVVGIAQNVERMVFPQLRLPKGNRRTQGGKGVDWPQKEVDAG